MLPVTATAASWSMLVAEPGKRLELDRDSIVADPAGKRTLASARIVLDKPIVDPRTSDSYRIIQAQNRFDCNARTYATVGRIYFKSETEILREDDIINPNEMPVRSGTPVDRLMREVCRPKPGTPALADATRTADKVSEAAAELRKANERLVADAVKKDLQRISPTPRPAAPAASKAPVADQSTVARPTPRARKAAPPVHPAWSYAGDGGPENWGHLHADYALCGSGQRQAPIDIRDGIAVDLEPIRFSYVPAPFRVKDNGRTLQISTAAGGLSLLGKEYALLYVEFRRPAETTVNGIRSAMEAQLVHRAGDGALAVLSVLLEQGAENLLVQTALNHLPLEKGGEVEPPGRRIDIGQFVPTDGRYYAFMGSLTTPPCPENVLWLVLKQAQQISPEQLSIFQRLYPPNARPAQSLHGRIIKESR
ncbi:carbonic anhydrase [Propionivibrio limicola]|uniref:carbonic anhydrase n=1 Tax=Propionivibrio limicola TaxID=167645 RepID=UPI001B86E7F0|nr:carbonic anhydrase family protein [Propionivibrio limicola]